MNAIADKFKQEVEAIRASRALGDKGRLLELFEYLAAHSQNNDPLSENLVAAEVFGKRDFSASSDDASVRVYIHRLRKKLDDYYAGLEPELRQNRLVLPRGEYRLVLETTENKKPAVVGSKKLNYRFFSLLVVINLLAWLLVVTLWPKENVKTSALTALLAQSDRPIAIIVGDYYMFGQKDEQQNLSVLIRDFDVNTPVDRERYYPDSVDVGLTYLPPSAAYALSDIIPVIERSGRGYYIIKASAANSNSLKNNDVIYLGLFSGLGFLEPLVFEDSGLMMGDSYDEISNKETGDYFVSGEAEGLIEGKTYYDYGYFQLKYLSSDNLMLVIAGTRDTGLRGISEILKKQEIPEVFDKLALREHMEVLFEIEGQQQANINSRIVFSD